jgi:hypothetical protein
MGKERLADGKGTVGRWERNDWQMGKEQLEDEGKRKNYSWKQGGGTSDDETWKKPTTATEIRAIFW